MVGAAGGILRSLENAAKVYFLAHSGWCRFVFYSKYKHEWALRQGPSLRRENVVLLTNLLEPRFPETGGSLGKLEQPLVIPSSKHTTDWSLQLVPLQREFLVKPKPREAAEPSPGAQGPAQADARLERCLSDTVMEALKYSRQMGACLLVPFTVGWRKWENREVTWGERMSCFSLDFLGFFSYTANCVIY